MPEFQEICNHNRLDYNYVVSQKINLVRLYMVNVPRKVDTPAA